MVAMKGVPSPTRARALALAAVRETFEEAGLLIGTPLPAGGRDRKAQAWQEFFAHGYPPGAGAADVLCARHHAAGPAAPVRHALLLRARRGGRSQSRDCGRRAVRPRMALDAQARTLELPNITRVVLEDLGERIAAGALQRQRPCPCHSTTAATAAFHRDLIDAVLRTLT